IERWSDAALCVGSIGKYRGHGHLDEYADAQRALAVTPYTCRSAPAAACPSSRRRSSWSRSRSRTPEEILEESYMLGTRQYSLAGSLVLLSLLACDRQPFIPDAEEPLFARGGPTVA